MCDMYEELLSEKEKEIEQLEFQIEQCQQEIRRLRNVCRYYEKERDIRQECGLVSFEDILKRLGAEVPFSIGQGSEILFTEDGAKAYEDLKKILYAIQRIAGLGMNVSKVDGLLRILTAKGEEEAEIYQLRLLLQIFDEYGWKGSYSVGNWSIANGGYDLWFEIYYNQIAQIQCIAGELTVVNEEVINSKAVLNCILEVYSNVRAREEE